MSTALSLDQLQTLFLNTGVRDRVKKHLDELLNGPEGKKFQAELPEALEKIAEFISGEITDESEDELEDMSDEEQAEDEEERTHLNQMAEELKTAAQDARDNPSTPKSNAPFIEKRTHESARHIADAWLQTIGFASHDGEETVSLSSNTLLPPDNDRLHHAFYQTTVQHGFNKDQTDALMKKLNAVLEKLNSHLIIHECFVIKRTNVGWTAEIVS